MKLLSFINQWLTGAKLIGTIIAWEIVIFGALGAVIGAFVLIFLIPEWVLGIAFAIILVVFGPWAMAERWE